MPVPSKMADLFTIAASNSPAGSDLIGNSLDDYLRAGFAILRSTNALASASIAAASTTDLSTADGESVQITGSATITSLGTAVSGLIRECRFTGACVLTNSAAIALPGSANITTTAGDSLTFRSLGSGNWQLVAASNTYGYLPLSGGTLTGTLNGTNGSFTGTLGATGNITSGGVIQALQTFQAASTNLILAAAGGTGAGINFRPNGAGSTTGQVTIGAAGDLTSPGNITAFQNFTTQTLTAVYSNGGSGSILLRPNGSASTTGQLSLGSTGALTASGDIVAFQNIYTQTSIAVFACSSSSPGGIFFRPNGPASGTGQMTLSTTGVCSAPDFQATSDISLKRNITELRRGLDELHQMLPRQYEKKVTDEEYVTNIGFIAQEVQKVVPEAVSVGQDGLLTVSYVQLVALIASAVLQLDDRLKKAGL